MTAFLDRFGLARFWEWVRNHFDLFRKRRRVTEGHLDQERETEVTMGLMAAALATPGGMSPEQEIMVGEQKVGARKRISRLLDIPDRSLAEERELLTLQRGLREADPPLATPQSMGNQRMSLFGAVGQANPLLGLAMNPMTWAIVGLVGLGGANALTGYRLDHAKHDLSETRADLQEARDQLAARTIERDMLKERAQAADAQSLQTAANIEAERARRVRTERELRRIRDAVAQAGSNGPIDYGFGGVRDDTGASPGPDSGASAPAGDPR